MLATLNRQNCLQNLRASMLKANVPESTINQIIGEQAQTEIFTGIVMVIGTGHSPSGQVVTSVVFYGQALYSDRKKYWVSFPPNSPEFLPELIRAQNNPNLRVHFAATEKPEPGGWGTGESPKFINLDVYYHGAPAPVDATRESEFGYSTPSNT